MTDSSTAPASRHQSEWIQQLLKMTNSDDRISPLVASRVSNVLEVLHMLDNTFPDLMDTHMSGKSLNTSISAALGKLPILLAENDDAKLFDWARELNASTRAALERFLDPRLVSNSEFGDIESVANALGQEEQRLSIMLDELRYRSRAANLFEAAEETASRLQEAAGIGGGASLSEHFAAYARREWWSANLFRAFTIVSIGCGVAAAILLPHPLPGDWVNFAYRVAQLVGVAALATYLGRQAGQHRRVLNWAKSMQVQLQSFPAFIEPINDPGTVSGIYNAFARRVLGPPPEKAVAASASESETGVLSPQLLELLVAVAKKS